MVVAGVAVVAEDGDVVFDADGHDEAVWFAVDGVDSRAWGPEGFCPCNENQILAHDG